MTNLYNGNHAMVIVDRVHHAVVALAHAIVILAGQLLMPRRTGNICQSVNTVSDTPEVGLRRPTQLSLRRSLDSQLYASITLEFLEDLHK